MKKTCPQPWIKLLSKLVTSEELIQSTDRVKARMKPCLVKYQHPKKASLVTRRRQGLEDQVQLWLNPRKKRS
jgi:hypothetical protein